APPHGSEPVPHPRLLPAAGRPRAARPTRRRPGPRPPRRCAPGPAAAPAAARPRAARPSLPPVRLSLVRLGLAGEASPARREAGGPGAERTASASTWAGSSTSTRAPRGAAGREEGNPLTSGSIRGPATCHDFNQFTAASKASPSWLASQLGNFDRKVTQSLSSVVELCPGEAAVNPQICMVPCDLLAVLRLKKVRVSADRR
ncbi:hypothetical protein E2320_000846, partial [Naja naja]